MVMEGSKDSWATLVPMGSLPLLNAITTTETPSDDRENHTFLRALCLPESSRSYEDFQSLVDSFFNETKGKR